ncbi:MAG: tripartite tricarboxylate transporter substrate binding protein [Ottowia sp.]|uniref:Bug family tripartite tricarboxylate transporter substrate binding protein n=1 Tax=unclassified Ottowia TaxID=2645081 RepID=UPI003C2AD747
MKTARGILAVCAAALALAAGAQTAQDYPAQPVKIVVPFPPGGGTDTVSRILLDPLGRKLGRQFVMDYKPGGNTVIGTNAAAHAAPDGYTLLTTLDMTATILPAVYSKLPFDPQKQLTPVAVLATVPALLMVNPKIPARNLKELIAYDKANPGKLNYGSAVLHGQLFGEALKLATGLQYTYVPYKGSAEAVQALAGGHIDMLFLDIATGLGFIKDGRVRPIVITVPKRHPSVPDVQTVAEAGYPGLEMSVWYGLFAPTGTPPAIVEKLHAGLEEVAKDPAIQKRLADLGHETSTLTPPQIKELIRKDSANWAKAAAAGNIKLD